MKVAIYGTGINASNVYYMLTSVAEAFGIIKMECFLETKKSKSVFHGKTVREALDFDYKLIDKLVIASEAYDEILAYLEENLEDYDLLNGKIVSCNEIYTAFGKNAPFQSLTVNGLCFINASSDRCILPVMRHTGKVFSEWEIDAFFELTKKYYGTVDHKGYFLDIGANIGTTSIYIKKRVNSDLQVIAFECCQKNYDLLRVNMILNGTEDIQAEHIGLGDENCMRRLIYCPSNPGMSRFEEYHATEGTEDICESEEVAVMTLDSYVEKHDICPKDISYIWMDTEGAEAEIISGAGKIFQNGKIPFLQEFNPKAYEREHFDLYFSQMCKTYRGFLDLQELAGGSTKEHEIAVLQDYGGIIEDHGRMQADLFFF